MRTTAPERVSTDDRAIEAGRAVEAVWRIESARIVAVLARRTGDLGLAEVVAQEALVGAREQWPGSGTPRPAAGLVVVDALAASGALAVSHLLPGATA